MLTPKTGNCEDDLSCLIINYDDLVGQQSNTVRDKLLHFTESVSDTDLNVVAPALQNGAADDEMRLNAMTYIAGFVCRRVLFRHRCDTCRDAIVRSGVSESNVTDMFCTMKA